MLSTYWLLDYSEQLINAPCAFWYRLSTLFKIAISATINVKIMKNILICARTKKLLVDEDCLSEEINMLSAESKFLFGVNYSHLQKFENLPYIMKIWWYQPLWCLGFPEGGGSVSAHLLIMDQWWDTEIRKHEDGL